MKIDRYASLPHYAEHLDPIWQALPAEVRGESWAPRAGCWWGKPEYVQPGPHAGPVLVAGFADARKMHPRPLVYVEHGAGQAYPGDPRSAANGSYAGGLGLDRVVLFIAPSETVADRWRAAYQDNKPVAVVGCPRLDSWHGRMVGGGVLAEGGEAGQRLLDLDRGEGAERLRPSPDRRHPPAGAPGGLVDEPRRVAEGRGPRLPQPGHDLRGRPDVPAPGVRQPGAPHERDAEGQPRGVAADGSGPGLSPRSPLDPGEHLRDAERAAAVPRVQDRPPVVAVTFHWDCQLIPETRSAFPHYRAALHDLVNAVRAAGGEVWGHGHPRAWGRLQRTWRTLGVPLVPDMADVLDGAGVLVADNTSAAYEFASLDRPVITLNAPWYRRNVEHGLRFWSHVPGDQVNDPAELAPVVLRALAGPEHPHVTALRRRAVAHVYDRCDGHAADRAVAAILEVLG